MTGAVKGRLTGWLRTVKGDWLASWTSKCSTQTAGENPVALRDQLAPAYALRRREPDK